MKSNTIFKTFCIGVLPFLLVSCFAARDYEQPEIVNEAYYRTDVIQQDSTTMANLAWRELFTDPVLQAHIEEALLNNIDIRIALQQIRASEAYFKQGKAAYFPSLSGGAQYSRQEFSSSSQFGNQFTSLDQYQIGVNLSWEADIWGKIKNRERATAARYLQTVAAHQAVTTELISNIATLYYQLLSLDEQIRVTQRTVLTREESLETIEALKEAGIVTGVGVQQTEAQVYTAQALLVDLQTQVRLVENTFSILQGKEPGTIERTQLDAQEITTPLQTGVPAQLLRNRPDVLAAEYNLANAFELTNVARSNFYPSFTIDATAGLQSLDIAQLFDPNSFFANIVAGLTQPIFNQRQIRTQYEVSQAQQEEARLNFRSAFLTATREVSDALYQYNAATEKIEIKQNEFNAYDTATRYSEELLENGLVNYLEVLTARENSLRSRLDLVEENYNQLQAIVDLYQALGGGWQ